MIDPELVGWMGTCAAVCLLLSPLQSALLMRSLGCTGGRQPYQYAAMFVASVLWVLYGSLISSAAVVVCNAVGVLTGIACLVIFVQVLIREHGRASRQVARSMNVIMLVATTCLAAVFYAAMMGHKPETASFLGFGAACFAIAMFGAPLAQMRLIVATKSAQVLSPLLLGVALVNTTIWSVYGVMREDLAIFVPNALGLLVTIPQIALYLRYRVNATPRPLPIIPGEAAVEGAPAAEELQSAGGGLDMEVGDSTEIGKVASTEALV